MASEPDLDEQFGPPMRATYIRDSELVAEFAEVFELNEAVAGQLEDLQELANRSTMLRSLALGLCLLWAVDETGRVLISVEVACKKKSVSTHFPRMRDMPLDAALEALGHPLLVERGPARIGGELFLDDVDRGLGWVISNKSGRYGFGERREPRHLENVAGAFSQVGLAVQTSYLQGG